MKDEGGCADAQVVTVEFHRFFAYLHVGYPLKSRYVILC